MNALKSEVTEDVVTGMTLCKFFRLETTTPIVFAQKTLQMAGRGDNGNPKQFLKIPFLFTFNSYFYFSITKTKVEGLGAG